MGRPSPDNFYDLVWSTAPTIRTLSTSTAKSAQLAVGLYEIVSDVDCFVLQGATGVVATTSSIPLYAKAPRLMYVPDTTDLGFVAGIVASGTGNLYIIPRKGD